MPQVDIIVGSQMGSAEYVAEQLQEALEDQGFETVLHEQPNFDDCQQAHWLVVTSTYGAGDYPDNLLSFIEQITAQSSLSQLKHAVVGIGDSSYDTYEKFYIGATTMTYTFTNPYNTHSASSSYCTPQNNYLTYTNNNLWSSGPLSGLSGTSQPYTSWDVNDKASRQDFTFRIRTDFPGSSNIKYSGNIQI